MAKTNIPIVYEIKSMRLQEIDCLNQACYNKRADYWDRFPFPSDLPALIEKYCECNPTKRVLDVGSGTGMLGEWLVNRGYDVICLDPSTEMVRRCRAKGLQTLQCSIQDYKPDRQFELIFAILSLIHVPKEEFLVQIKKLTSALTDKGYLFLALLEGSGECISEGPEYPRFFAYFTREEVQEKVAPWLTIKDYRYHKSGSIGYMLFVLSKTGN